MFSVVNCPFISSHETREALLKWRKHDDEAERFCIVDGKIEHLFNHRAKNCLPDVKHQEKLTCLGFKKAI